MPAKSKKTAVRSNGKSAKTAAKTKRKATSSDCPQCPLCNDTKSSSAAEPSSIPAACSAGALVAHLRSTHVGAQLDDSQVQALSALGVSWCGSCSFPSVSSSGVVHACSGSRVDGHARREAADLKTADRNDGDNEEPAAQPAPKRRRVSHAGSESGTGGASSVGDVSAPSAAPAAASPPSSPPASPVCVEERPRKRPRVAAAAASSAVLDSALAAGQAALEMASAAREAVAAAAGARAAAFSNVTGRAEAKELCQHLPPEFDCKPRLYRNVPVAARANFLAPVRQLCTQFEQLYDSDALEEMAETMVRFLLIPRKCLRRNRAGVGKSQISAVKKKKDFIVHSQAMRRASKEYKLSRQLSVRCAKRVRARAAACSRVRSRLRLRLSGSHTRIHHTHRHRGTV